MKKRNFSLLAILFVAFSLVLSSCDKDEDNNDNPTTPNDGYTVLSGDITGNKTLDATKTYLLDGFVLVQDGATLTIPAGTLIEANPGQGENASALIVMKGGMIDAQGTAADPIIFTGKGDGKDGVFIRQVQGLWGGLVILGKATTNNTVAKRIEGIPDEYNAYYGFDANTGASDDDNSGTLTYVSIRHGGTDIGAGNEINGLSLGAVGSGTTFDYIEVISNIDDGIEFFGGAANVKHAFVALCGDDSYDYDEGFHGYGQFWVAIQDDKTGDRCAEQDGGTGSNEESAPYAEPMIYNATYIGNQLGNFVIFRDNAAGTYANSIFHNAVKGIRIEYRDDKHSSYDWMTDNAATLAFANNIFSSLAGGDTATSIYAKAEAGTLPATHAADVAANLFSNGGNVIEDILTGTDEDIADIDPIPAAASAAPTAATPAATFFDAAAYHGAFQPGGTNWADGWTLFYK